MDHANPGTKLPDPSAISLRRPGTGVSNRQSPTTGFVCAGSTAARRSVGAGLWLWLQGVLAIAASALGCGSTVGIDIDPQAIIAVQAEMPSRTTSSPNSASPEPACSTSTRRRRRQYPDQPTVAGAATGREFHPGCWRPNCVVVRVLQEQADEVMAIYRQWSSIWPSRFR